jgi:hypothetical protein
MRLLARFLRTLPLLLALFLCLLAFRCGYAQASAERPCDILAAATPCVAAISTTRALYRDYTGPLYQVTRKSDGTSQNVGLLPGGYANAAQQDAFCGDTDCTITKLYDQSPHHNDLLPAPPGGAASGPGPKGFDLPVEAGVLPIQVDGHKVYGMSFSPGMGYRNNRPHGTAVDSETEGVYMLTSAFHLNHRCCFDFGNAETNSLDNKHGHMDAINIKCSGGYRDPRVDQKQCLPDAGLDMEDGIPGHFPVPADTPFVTVMGSNDGKQTYAIYEGNAQTGALASTGIIPLPSVYQPMKMEGAIILGIGGDNSNWAEGYFFEGVMTHGAPTPQAMQAVHANITAAKYSGLVKPSAP